MSAVNIRTLSRGPNFVYQPNMSDTTIRDMEVSMERMAFETRWIEHIKASRLADKKKQNSEQSDRDSESKPQEANLCLDKDVRLRKLLKPSKQPPALQIEDENEIRRLKDVVGLYQKHKEKQRGDENSLRLTKDEYQHLKKLKADDGVIVKPSDKSKGFVVMSRSSYVDKCTKLLDDDESYEKMEIKAEHLDNNTKEFVKSNLKEKLP